MDPYLFARLRHNLYYAHSVIAQQYLAILRGDFHHVRALTSGMAKTRSQRNPVLTAIILELSIVDLLAGREILHLF